jgi:hypothetical protein
MDHTPPAAAPDCPTDADTCQCRAAACPQCGGGLPSDMTERHKRNLAELGEMGMDLARRLHLQMRCTGIVADQETGIFERITRTVRRAHALEAKLDADSRKTAEQRAAEQARRDAAADRARQPRQPDAPAAAATPAARERHNLLNDLRDRDDTMSDLRDLADDADLDDEDGPGDKGGPGALAGDIADLGRSLSALRQEFAVEAKRGDAVRKTGVAERAPPAPGGRFAPQAGLTPIPPALAWPPRATAAHDPPR